MFLTTGKWFIFLSLLIFWAVYAPSLAAQTKKHEQTLTAEAQLKTLATEIEAALDEAPIDKTIDESQTIGSRREDIFGDKNVDENFKKHERSETNRRAAANDFTHHFPLTAGREGQTNFNDSITVEPNKFSFRPERSIADSPDDADKLTTGDGFRWKPAIAQSMMFLAVQHGYALVFQQKTRDALKGKFFKDYINSVKSLHGWDDGNRFFTNYIAHPMQGALTGYIYIQNQPKEMYLEFNDPGYWKSRAKAFVWSTAWSTQWEIGPISQSAIGNVGLNGKLAWGDLVITPIVGTALLITEDAIDRFIMKRIERRTNNFYIKVFMRLLLNPTRNFSNLLRFKEPWYRDRPKAQ